MDGILMVAGLAALVIIPTLMTFEIDEFAGSFFKEMKHLYHFD